MADAPIITASRISASMASPLSTAGASVIADAQLGRRRVRLEHTAAEALAGAPMTSAATLEAGAVEHARPRSPRRAAARRASRGAPSAAVEDQRRARRGIDRRTR